VIVLVKNLENTGISKNSASGIGHENVRRGGDFLVRCDIAGRKSRKFRDFNKFCEWYRPPKKS